jgi:hypothetical protein
MGALGYLRNTPLPHIGKSAIQYMLILSEMTEDTIQVTIQGLPTCMIKAATRDETVRVRVRLLHGW